MKKLALIFIIIALIYSCSTNKNKYFKTGNNDFSILVPTNLIQPSETEDGSLINLVEDTSDILNGLSIVIYSDSIVENGVPISITDYSNYIAENLLDETSNSDSIFQPKDTVINGLKCQTFKICGLYNNDILNKNVCYFNCIFQVKTKFYALTIWCSQDKVNYYLPSIYKILYSFKEKLN